MTNHDHAPAKNTAKIKWRCARCNHRFSERDALCENWEDPKLSFIGPKCESYLSRFPPPMSKSEKSRKHLKFAITLAGYSILLFTLVALYYWLDQMFWRLKGLFWLIIAGLIALGISRRRPKYWRETYLVNESQRIEDAVVMPIDKDETQPK